MASLKHTIVSSEVYRSLVLPVLRHLRFGMYSPWIRHHICLIILSMLAFLSILWLFRVIDPYPLRDWVSLRETLISLGLVGPVIFVLLTAVLPLFSPMSILVVTGAASFGPAMGIILSYIGAQLNANITFLLVRTLAVEERWGKGESLSKIKASIKRNGFPIVLLMHTLSLFPFVAVNSAAAASGIRWEDFAKGTLAGTILPIVIYSLIGEALIPRIMPPEVYFAFVAFIMLVIIVAAFKKRDAYLRRKGV
ncbi:MAG TPA: VTT domain-containing protein [Deltaproteobacteria bacterium]|nr:VTT domain-containing protein [Deltaproteobacteria bacterium]HQJ09317.1 VTT domain-containing protein [Deltaproteobacteria bacterium]